MNKMIDDLLKTIKEVPNLLFPHLYLNKDMHLLAWKWLFVQDTKWVQYWNFEILMFWMLNYTILLNVGPLIHAININAISSFYLVGVAMYMLYGILLIGVIGYAYRKNKK